MMNPLLLIVAAVTSPLLYMALGALGVIIGLAVHYGRKSCSSEQSIAYKEVPSLDDDGWLEEGRTVPYYTSEIDSTDSVIMPRQSEVDAAIELVDSNSNVSAKVVAENVCREQLWSFTGLLMGRMEVHRFQAVDTQGNGKVILNVIPTSQARRMEWERQMEKEREKSKKRNDSKSVSSKSKIASSKRLEQERIANTALSLSAIGKHPCIMQPLYVKAIKDRSITVVTYNWIDSGSLRDLIYKKPEPKKSLCGTSWQEEENDNDEQGQPLPDILIKTYAKHIMTGLMYLRSLGIKFSHLHAGNVFIIDGVAQIGSIENELFSLPSDPNLDNMTFPFEDRCSVDYLQFGLLLYEMCVGRSLQDTDTPMKEGLQISYGVRDMLDKIFCYKESTFGFEKLIRHPYFKDVAVPSFDDENTLLGEVKYRDLVRKIGSGNVLLRAKEVKNKQLKTSLSTPASSNRSYDSKGVRGGVGRLKYIKRREIDTRIVIPQ
jgi:hypothetical protein